MRKPLIAVAMLVIALALISTAGARSLAGPHARQGQCTAPAGGDLPTITSVTVGGVAIPAGSNESLPDQGKLYYSVSNNNGQGSLNGQDCLLTWQIDIRRSYKGAGPSNGAWSEIAGVGSSFLDHAVFARQFAPGYADSPEVNDATPIVITATVPTTGTYTKANAYWYTTTGTFTGNSPITWSPDGTTLTVAGSPAMYTHTPDVWPTGFATNFNPIGAPASTWDATPPSNNGQPDNGYGDSGPFGAGGPVAQVFARGLSFSFNLRFTTQTLGKGSEEQRGSWFETVNTPRWTNNFSNQGGSPQLQLGMGNYHSYYDLNGTEVLNTGKLRTFLPDAWAGLAFGVTSASDPTLIQGAIQVTRTESGSTAPIVATTTPVVGAGIIVNVGEVSFSSPNFTTKKNTAVKATVKGKSVSLRFKVTKAQLKASKNKVTIYGGSKKVKKLVTITAKVGTNTVSVKNVGKGGYVVKAGKTIIGSATLGSSSSGGGNGGKGQSGGKGDCPKQNCSNGGKGN